MKICCKELLRIAQSGHTVNDDLLSLSLSLSLYVYVFIFVEYLHWVHRGFL